jgi:PadR family transcriptional regulator, regulatory protein PadR
MLRLVMMCIRCVLASYAAETLWPQVGGDVPTEAPRQLAFWLPGYLYTSRVGTMVPPFRVTDATLDVLEVLLHPGTELYGLKIAKAAGRPTGSVFPILARLEACGWVNSEWEAGDPASRGARRRFYQLSPDGIVWAGELLAQRRAAPARRHPPRAAVLRPSWQAGQ